jgi:hypothetical protein
MKRFLIPIVVLLFSSFGFGDSVTRPHSTRVVASVSAVNWRGSGPAGKLGLAVWLVIHSPSQFAGARVIIDTKSQDRRSLRAEFPTGHFVILQLPDLQIKQCEDYLKAYENEQAELDQGAVGNGIIGVLHLAHIEIGDLPEPPKSLEPNL